MSGGAAYVSCVSPLEQTRWLIEHQMLVRRFLAHRGRWLAAEDLEDLVQEVFVRAIRGGRLFRGDSRYCTYLCGIALNVLREHAAGRRRHSRQKEAARSEQAQGNIVPDLAWNELLQRVEQAMASLTENQRQAMKAVYQEGRSVAEAASKVGCTVKAMRRRIEEARNRLQVRLGHCGVTCVLRKGQIGRCPATTGHAACILHDCLTHGC